MSSSGINRRQGELSGQLIGDGGRSALDRVLEALSREHNRYILYHLEDNETARLDELVDAVAASETGRAAEAVPTKVRTEIRTKLHHVRLPKLEDLGIVEYDERDGAVSYQHPPPHFEEFLQLAQDLEEDCTRPRR